MGIDIFINLCIRTAKALVRLHYSPERLLIAYAIRTKFIMCCLFKAHFIVQVWPESLVRLRQKHRTKLNAHLTDATRLLFFSQKIANTKHSGIAHFSGLIEL